EHGSVRGTKGGPHRRVRRGPDALPHADRVEGVPAAAPHGEDRARTGALRSFLDRVTRTRSGSSAAATARPAMPPPTTRTCCFGAIPPTLPMAGRRAHDVSGLDADDRHARLDDDLLGQRPEDEL